jgi:DNA polymerase-3 subunit delta'
MNENILPWHNSQWESLQQRRVQRKLPHALLFTGVEGVGKREFAKHFAHSLLCSQNLCGTCKSCQLFKAGYHPDLMLITPEDDKAIKVDTIRSIVDFVNQSAHISPYKIVIINPADKMNLNSANALLKTLEEPNAKIVLILITHRPMSLPATIRSRCQIVTFPVPEREVALSWLKTQDIVEDSASLLLEFAHGAPLKVIDFVEEDLLAFRKEIFEQWCELLNGKVALATVSQKWQKLDSQQILFHLTSWAMDLIRINNLEQVNLTNFDFASQLKNIAKKYDNKYLYKLYDDLVRAQNLLHGPCNLNPQLMFEGLLADWIIY